MKFLKCSKCGTMVAMVEEGKCAPSCCGEEMKELIPGTTDAAHEKHVPVVETSGNDVTVTVGSVEHPMQEEHSIRWIAIQTKQGAQRKLLSPGAKPVAKFTLADGDEFVAAFEYCNLHGLWKA